MHGREWIAPQIVRCARDRRSEPGSPVTLAHSPSGRISGLVLLSCLSGARLEYPPHMPSPVRLSTAAQSIGAHAFVTCDFGRCPLRSFVACRAGNGYFLFSFSFLLGGGEQRDVRCVGNKAEGHSTYWIYFGVHSCHYAEVHFCHYAFGPKSGRNDRLPTDINSTFLPILSFWTRRAIQPIQQSSAERSSFLTIVPERAWALTASMCHPSRCTS